jgi:hypothetical protein
MHMPFRSCGGDASILVGGGQDLADCLKTFGQPPQ